MYDLADKSMSVFLIPGPIGGPITEMSVSALHTLKAVRCVFIESRGRVVRALRKKNILSPKHRLQVMESQRQQQDLDLVHRLVERGESFAILADSGVPCFVDPGHHIVRFILDHHIDRVELQPVGLSSALDAALAMTGLDIQRFAFLGHYPECFDASLAQGHHYPAVAYVAGAGLGDFFARIDDVFPGYTRVNLFSNIRDRSRHRVRWWSRGEAPSLANDATENHVAVIERSLCSAASFSFSAS